MAGQGLYSLQGLLSDCKKYLLVFALLFFSVESWSACETRSGRTTCGGCNQNSCYIGRYGNGYLIGAGSASYIGVICHSQSEPLIAPTCRADGAWIYCSWVYCDTQAEADSAYCANNPSVPECAQPDVPSACEADYHECVSLGGVWKKVASTASQCASTCNLCNSAAETRVKNRVNQVCCQQGKAPPDSAQRCIPPTIGSNWGMAGSQFVTNDGSVSCGSLTTSDGEIIEENASLYKRFCIDGDEYEEQADSNQAPGSSSSEGGGSSSEDIGHSFGTELEALGGLYGVLDTIRDTLAKRLTPATEEIRDCLYNFKLCTALEPLQIDWSAMPQDSSYLYIDTAILKYIKPLMDSSVKLDSAQLKVLKTLDTNMLKQLGTDSAKLKNDTATRRVIASGFDGLLENDTSTRRAVNRVDSSVQDVGNKIVSLDSSLSLHLRGVEDGVDSLIDSMTAYLGKIGDGFGVLGDSIGAIRGILEGEYDGKGLYYDSAGSIADSVRHWIATGESKFDSAVSATEASWGVANLDSAWDSSYAYGECHGDDCPPCIDSDCLGSLNPNILRYGDSVASSLGDSLVENVKRQEDSLPSQWDTAFAKLREVAFFGAFDSTFLANVGAKIPNTNTCPDECFRQDVNGRYAFVDYNMTLDWNLCRPISASALNGLNAFDIIKLLARVVTIVTCLSILMWEVSSRRGRGIGL